MTPYEREQRRHGILEAIAFWLLRLRYRDSLRAWYLTDRKQPNGTTGMDSAEAVYVNFSPEMLALSRQSLHRQLDALIDTARQNIAQHPEWNVWRIGQLTLRWRTGVAATPLDFQWIGRNPDGTELKESA